MTISKLMETIPDGVKEKIVDFTDVIINIDGKKKPAIRVLLDGILPDAVEILKGKHLLYNEKMVAAHRYAPEIKKTYFYVY